MKCKATGRKSNLIDDIAGAGDRVRLVLTSLVLSALTAGCGSTDEWKSKRPKTVSTTGEVAYRGKPLADAMVTFTNSVAERSASGTTDANGYFKLTTFETGDGAVPGLQDVSIRKAEIDFPGTKLQGLTPEAMQATIKTMTQAELAALPDAQERWLIPKRYGTSKTSELTADVGEGSKNHFRFELRE